MDLEPYRRAVQIGKHLERLVDRAGEIAQQAPPPTDAKESLLKYLEESGHTLEPISNFDSFDNEDQERLLWALGGPANTVGFEKAPPEAVSLHNLGEKYYLMYIHVRDPRALEQAMKLFVEAVRHASWSDDLRPLAAGAFGTCLGARYELEGYQEDLDLAIENLKVAAEMAPSWEKRRGFLLDLGNQYMRLWQRTRDEQDLEAAVRVSFEAFNSMLPGYSKLTGLLAIFGTQLGALFTVRQRFPDVVSAMLCLQYAMNGTTDEATKAGLANNLGVIYEDRFNFMRHRQKGLFNIADLNRAIILSHQSLEHADQDHPYYAVRLNNLGRYLQCRSEMRGEDEKDADEQQAIDAFTKGWNSESAQLSLRIAMARDAAVLHARRSEWQEANSLLQKAIEFLPQLSPNSMQHEDKLVFLRQYSGMASLAASVAISASETTSRALELLEYGRGVIARSLMEIRLDVDSIGTVDHQLSMKIKELQDVLEARIMPPENPVDAGSGFELSKVDYRKAANARLAKLKETIQARPEYKHFLPHVDKSRFQHEAKHGPIIIINVSWVRCDALIVDKDGVKPAKTLEVTQEEIKQRAERLDSGDKADESMLTWLWDYIAGPALDAAGIRGPPAAGQPLPNVWWVTTGPLARLPIHAAGHHRSKGAGLTVLDRAISSYCSSIRSLVYGRQEKTTQSANRKAVLVGKEYIKGFRPLRFVPDELKFLRSLLASKSLELQPVDSKFTKEAVLHHLRGCRIFHFAGHGVSVPQNPSESHLVLEGETLTVAELLGSNFQSSSPFLGYLSACSTASTEEGIIGNDEGFNLVSALQLAGFRHAVGTLWPVSDRVCKRVTTFLYETIEKRGLTDAAVREGLHNAIKGLRDEAFFETATSDEKDEYEGSNPTAACDGSEDEAAAAQKRGMDVEEVGDQPYRAKSPLGWIPYVHFGV